MTSAPASVLVGAAVRRRAVAGWLLASMALASIAAALLPAVPPWPAGVLGWLGAALLVRQLGTTQRLQVGAIAAVGAALLVSAWLRGGAAPVVRAVAQNEALLSMLVSISFLRLISVPGTAAADDMPRGRAALAKTILGVHLFGAVINISSVIIMADRIALGRPLDTAAARLFSRAFSACAFWSPFIGGTAIVLAYIPQARLPVLLCIGIPMAACALGYTYLSTLWSRHGAVDDFVGYPIRFDSLVVPAVLAIAVLAVHEQLPAVSILSVIAAMALAMTTLVLTARQGLRRASTALGDHISRRLADMGGELCLFLAAGVLAVGVGSFVTTTNTLLPFTEMNATNASLTLCLLVALAVAGIHPIIVVSILAAMLVPISPDPDLTAAMFLMTWSIGNAASPLSGTHLILQGRYGIPSWRFSRWNVVYVPTMLLIAAGALHLYEWARSL